MAGGVTHGQQALGHVGARVQQVLSERDLGRYFLADNCWNLGRSCFHVKLVYLAVLYTTPRISIASETQLWFSKQQLTIPSQAKWNQKLV